MLTETKITEYISKIVVEVVDERDAKIKREYIHATLQFGFDLAADRTGVVDSFMDLAQSNYDLRKYLP